jgi:hypothetical protein
MAKGRGGKVHGSDQAGTQVIVLQYIWQQRPDGAIIGAGIEKGEASRDQLQVRLSRRMVLRGLYLMCWLTRSVVPILDGRRLAMS